MGAAPTKTKKQSTVLNGAIRRTEPTAEDIIDGITFDPQGRMKYHPEFHPNHGKPFEIDELIYIAKYYKIIDDARTVSFALGRTEHTIMSKAAQMRKTGEMARFQALTDEQWLEAIEHQAREKAPA